jgi:hypothetical protein
MKLLEYLPTIRLIPKISISSKQTKSETTMPGNTNGVRGTIGSQNISAAKIWQRFSEVDGSSFSDDGERIQALLATYAMLSRLETPWETIVRICMGQVIAT